MEVNSSKGSKYAKFSYKGDLLIELDTVLRRIEIIDCDLVKHVKIKRVVKSRHNYIRLSILNEPKLVKECEKALTLFESRYGMTWNRMVRRSIKKYQKTKEKIEKPKWSIISLNANSLKNKLEEVKHFLNGDKPTVICMQETYMKEGIDIKIPGYIIVESKEQGSAHGLLIGVRKEAGVIPSIVSIGKNLLTVKITSKQGSMKITNLYVHCSGSERLETIQKITDMVEDEMPHIFVGDWNMPPDELQGSILERGRMAVLEKLPKEGTRAGRSERVIDYAISNRKGLIESQVRLPLWKVSDHDPVQVRVDLTEDELPSGQLVFDRKRLKDEHVAKAICNCNFRCLRMSMDTQEMTSTFYEDLNKVFNKHSLLKEKKPVKPIWLCRKARFLLNKRSKSTILEEIKFLTKEVRKTIRESKKKQYSCFIQEGINTLKKPDSRASWKWIKAHCQLNKVDGDDYPIIDKATGELCNTINDQLRNWRDHFVGLVSKPENVSLITQQTTKKCDLITDSPITWEEIRLSLTGCGNNKATGEDLIPSEVYKLVSGEKEPKSRLADAIFRIVKKAWNEGETPEEWRSCLIVVLHKKGSKSDPNNYRGIALMNTLLKVICKIVAKRLADAAAAFQLIRREQVGFISGEECPAQAMCLIEAVQRRCAKGQDTLMCFLDLKKAYDLVPQERLFVKLVGLGIGAKMMKFIRSLYAGTRMKVRLKGGVSEGFENLRGVRQGCPTSPIIFNMFINDILEGLEGITVPGLPDKLPGLCFADDTVLFAESIEEMKINLDKIQKWMQINCMEINTTKCGLMWIKGSGTERIGQPIEYEGNPIPWTENYTYLGIEINQDLDLEKMAKSRATRGYVLVKQLEKSLTNNRVPIAFKRMLIQNMLIPKLIYGGEIFGMSAQRAKEADKIANMAIAKVLRKPKFCRHRAYEELGIETVEHRMACSRARGWAKWIKSHGLISELIKTAKIPLGRKRTIIKRTQQWIKRMKIATDGSKEDIVKSTKETLKHRKIARDKTIIGNIARICDFGYNKLIQEIECEHPRLNRGIQAILKLRTGTFRFTNELVKSKWLESKWLNRCICCKEETKENMKHLLFDCKAFETERRKCLQENMHRVAQMGKPMNCYDLAVGLCLAGTGAKAMGVNPVQAVVQTTRFLNIIIVKRLNLIKEARENLQS